MCRKHSYPCSPNLTILRHVSAGSEYVPGKKRSPTWQNSAADMQKIFGGSNLVSRRLLVMTACAAGSRAPILESKARKLVFYKRWDKESFVEELEMLKVAVTDQAYHFNLHKVHIHNLRTLHHRLEEKLAAIESIDGGEAPRTGGASRLSAKVGGGLHPKGHDCGRCSESPKRVPSFEQIAQGTDGTQQKVLADQSHNLAGAQGMDETERGQHQGKLSSHA